MALKNRLLCGIFLVTSAISLQVRTASSKDPILEQAASLYRLRAKQQGALTQAIDLLSGFLARNPSCYDALWMQSRNYWYKGYHGNESRKNRLVCYEKARDYANRASTVDEGRCEGHYWNALATGLCGQETGILKSLSLVGTVRKRLEQCLLIDSEHSDAYRALAELYFRVPGPPLSIGNKKKALDLIRKAIHFGPTNPENWLLCAEILMDARDYGGTREAVSRTLALPDDDEDPLWSQEIKRRARGLLVELALKAP